MDSRFFRGVRERNEARRRLREERTELLAEAFDRLDVLHDQVWSSWESVLSNRVKGGDRDV
jgi:hypothetical protein